MFTNLIESDSHRKEFKRRSSFFLATVAGYAVILFAASIAGIYAYDARVEAQTTELLVDWIPPIKPAEVRDQPRVTQPTRRNIARSNAPVDPNIEVAERTTAIAPTNDPTKIPDNVGIKAADVPPTIGEVRLTNRNVNPPGVPDTKGNCATCTGTDPQPRVAVDNTTPPPVPTPMKTRHVSTGVLIAKIVNLPKPVYPTIAKQIRAQGPVNVQILVDETGKVISATAVNGNATLIKAAEEAAMRARFTPTMLNDKPIKVQGVITYNFVLQQ